MRIIAGLACFIVAWGAAEKAAGVEPQVLFSSGYEAVWWVVALWWFIASFVVVLRGTE